MITGDIHVTEGDRELSVSKTRVSTAMPRTRAQREQEMVTEGGWADMREELLAMVLENLQAAGQSKPEGSFGFSVATATVRLVCSGWKAMHDAVVMRLVLRLQTTDEAVGMLARRFPAVVSVEFKHRRYMNGAC